MPQRDHSSVLPAEACNPQLERDWQRLVEERLPADLEDQAEALKAFQRARGLPSALHLLRVATLLRAQITQACVT